MVNPEEEAWSKKQVARGQIIKQRGTILWNEQPGERIESRGKKKKGRVAPPMRLFACSKENMAVSNPGG